METFVVRVWVPAAGRDGSIRGVVERIGAGQPVTFRSGEELLAIIAAGSTAQSVASVRGRQT